MSGMHIAEVRVVWLGRVGPLNPIFATLITCDPARYASLTPIIAVPFALGPQLW